MTGHDKLVELRDAARTSVNERQRARFDAYILVRAKRRIPLKHGMVIQKGEYALANPASIAYGEKLGYNFMAVWHPVMLCDQRVPARAVETVMGGEELP
jgi:hypothetical protein